MACIFDSNMAQGAVELPNHKDLMAHRIPQSAFSLVELSIVLVILGLLTGGVLTGRSLIRAAELRSVMADADRFGVAVRAFQNKYFGLPGDLPNATSFWGQNPVGSGGGITATTAAATATWNGSGDGRVLPEANPAPGVYAHQEAGAFWQHLADAGLIEGTYNGGDNVGGTPDADITYLSFASDLSSPKSRIGNAWWSGRYISPTALYYTTGRTGHAFILSTAAGGCNPTPPGGVGVLAPEDMYNIDTKLDDGVPNTGKVVVPNSNFSQGGWGCYTANGGNCLVQSASLWRYDLTSSSRSCAPVIYWN